MTRDGIFGSIGTIKIIGNILVFDVNNIDEDSFWERI